MVSEVKVIYFDTIPVCTSLSVLKTGFLLAAVESGNQYDNFPDDTDVCFLSIVMDSGFTTLTGFFLSFLSFYFLLLFLVLCEISLFGFSPLACASHDVASSISSRPLAPMRTRSLLRWRAMKMCATSGHTR